MSESRPDISSWRFLVLPSILLLRMVDSSSNRFYKCWVPLVMLLSKESYWCGTVNRAVMGEPCIPCLAGNYSMNSAFFPWGTGEQPSPKKELFCFDMKEWSSTPSLLICEGSSL